MLDSALLAACVLLPLAGSLLLPLAGCWSARVRDGAALGLVLGALGAAAALLPTVLAGRTVTLSAGGVALLHADRLAVFMALVSTLLGAVIVVYSWGYLARLAHRGEYYVVVVLFLGAMMALVFARNLLVLYAGWELTAVACWRLIAFHRDETAVARAGKAFLVTALGAVTMLLGFVEIGASHGTFDLGRLQGTPLSALATALVLVGLLSKSATLPLHSWLPDAGVAPAPVTALLHAAVLVKIGVYVHARLFGATFVADAGVLGVVPWIAAASALLAGAAALLESDLKRIIAYSTVSQLGFVFLGLSVGGATAAGGALLFVLVHALAKGGLFLCAGVIEHAVHTKDVRRMGGLARRLPVTAVAFALCAFSVMGLPPFGGFFAKHLVVAGAFEAGRVPLGLAFVAGSVLTVAYLTRVFALVFLGEEGSAVRGHDVHEGSPAMVGAVAVLAALSLASGAGVAAPAALAEAAARDLASLGGAPAPGLHLGLHLASPGPAAPLLAAIAVAGVLLGALAVRALSGRRPLAAGAALLAILAAVGVAVAGEGIALLLAWEALLVPALALLGAAGGPRGPRAALRAFLTWAVADLVLLAGLGILEGRAAGAAVTPGAAGLALALVAAGAAARLGAMPFHGWIADAAEELPAPALALVLTLGKLAGTALLVRMALEHGLAGGAARAVLLGLGALSVALGAGLAAVQADPRRRVALLSVAHGGLVLLAAGAGQPAAAVALAIAGALALALLHLVAGARMKTSLSSSAGGGGMKSSLSPRGAGGEGRGEGGRSLAARRLLAAERALEPGRLARGALDLAAVVAFAAERAVNALLDVAAPRAAAALAAFSRRAHDGSHATYLVWSMVGVAALVLLLAGAA